MPKTRAQKEQLIQKYKEALSQAKAIVFTSLTNLKSKELAELKEKIKAQEGESLVLKNRLFAMALQEKNLSLPAEILDRPLLCLFGYQDEIAPMKTIIDFAVEHSKPEILGALFNQNFIDPARVKELALLPGRNELYQNLLGLLRLPALRLIQDLTYHQRRLVFILNNYLNERSQNG